MLLSLGVLPSFHSVKKHAPHKWIMPRKPILEFSENHWNVRSSDPFQGNRQHRRTSFTFRYKCAKLVRRSRASPTWLITPLPSLVWSLSQQSFLLLSSTFSPNHLTFQSWRRTKQSKVECHADILFEFQIMNTQDLLVLLVSFGTACFVLNIYKLNQPTEQWIQQIKFCG